LTDTYFMHRAHVVTLGLTHTFQLRRAPSFQRGYV
jgi:hypothetical protein